MCLLCSAAAAEQLLCECVRRMNSFVVHRKRYGGTKERRSFVHVFYPSCLLSVNRYDWNQFSVRSAVSRGIDRRKGYLFAWNLANSILVYIHTFITSKVSQIIIRRYFNKLYAIIDYWKTNKFSREFIKERNCITKFYNSHNS